MHRRLIHILPLILLLGACNDGAANPEDVRADADAAAPDVDVPMDTGGDAQDATPPQPDTPAPVDAGRDGDAVPDTTPDVIDVGPPPVMPPFEGFEEPGWRDSEDPLCRPDDNSVSYSYLWADDRGVFVFDQLNTEGATTRVWQNDGSGWTVVLEIPWDPRIPERFDRLWGMPNGGLWLLGGAEHLRIDLDDGSFSPGDGIGREVFAVNESLAYALVSDAPGLLRFDGETWSPYAGDPMPFDPSDFAALWASETRIFVGGENGTIMSTRDGEWTVHNTGTIHTFSRLWGNADDDVRAGTPHGELFHYDGTTWVEVDWARPDFPCGSDGIGSMWGAEGVIYAFTGNALLRIEQGTPEVIASWPGAIDEETGACQDALWIREMWGTGPNDVFFVMMESDLAPRACQEYVVHFDGEAFHWF